MQPNYFPISKVFSDQTHHTVPLFQRPYVWTLDDQWEPLWEDVAGLLERLEARIGEEPVASHFLGTIVLEQVQNSTGSLPRREVIDGQQRLTTLQIVLKAAEHALQQAEENVDSEDEKTTIARRKRQLVKLTENDGDGVERYKVWPTNEDRSSFQAVLDADAANGVGHNSGSMGEAYRFFRSAFVKYLDGGERVHRAQLLADALQNHLKLIVLDLDPSDEPQAIFETLNAHGTPLLPADLIKNWLLWEAARQHLDAESLYERFWRAFDREHHYWRKKVGTGHAARARVDTFLQNWLTKEMGEPISTKHLYDRFLRHITKLKSESSDNKVNVEYLMMGIRSDAYRFERIDNPTDRTRFDLFLQRLKAMDVIVFHPLLLAVLARLEGSQKELDQLAIVLESYLVRRMICAYQTRGYGTLALSLHKQLSEAPVDKSQGALLEELLLAEGGSNTWPSDDEFRGEWLRRRFYGGLRRDRVMMILQALEHYYQSNAHLAEPLMTFDWSQLQIEHILPQSWRDHWSLPENVTPDQRDMALHGIGNLTLVSERLNPSLSNAPWTCSDGRKKSKSDALHKFTRLELNRRLLDQFKIWCDENIRLRADELYNVAKEIWPRNLC